ncbi:hypothetical protein [Pseudoclavibacter helvolus]|uniref:Head-to-tail adaptor n=1 Tax=Pseudoclavibacter helvolus TaxID=255205 RepID=A0A7W4YF98_9MICO|nr:hypothetical protein [Pseudoclavibacter helvolus]MBB2956791.1 hypothetical protein [Pseudoclavibacter helvolus]
MASPTPLATVTDLAEWIGEDISEEADAKRALRCLRAASVLVRNVTGKTWLDEAGGLLANRPDDVEMVTVYCASRIYDNREALTQGSLDDHSESFKVQEAGAYLTATEIRTLEALTATRKHGGLGVVATTRRPAPTVSGLVPTPDGQPIPWYPGG